MKIRPIQYTLAVLALAALTANAQGDKTEASQIPYPFEPPSDEFCQHNQLGSDIYVSFFKPCMLNFYKGTQSNNETSDSFSCDGIVDSTSEELTYAEERKVIGWPDSCVANGPRCYDLSKYPGLDNYTIFGDGDNIYSMSFPDDATYLSVDCSQDFQIAEEAMKTLPNAIEPLAHAIIFFGIMVFAGLLICLVVCCACIGNGGVRHRGGYSTIRGVYSGPPVEARKLTV